MYQQLLLLFGLVLFSAVFSGSETALVSLTQSKVDDLVAQKVRGAKLLKKLKADPHRLLITVLIGNNIVNVGSSAYAAVIFTEIFDSNGVGIATGVMTFMILIFGEITPKAFAHQHAAAFSLVVSKPIWFLQIVLFPFVWFFEKIVDLVNAIVGAKKRNTVTEGELVAMLKIGAQEGAIEKNEKELIENVLEFNDISVEEVMTPRVNFEALDTEMTIKQAVEFAKCHTHSRLPVYVKDLDNIIGIISIKELLMYYDEMPANKKLKSLNLKLPMEVPLTKRINKLFREFQRRHQHMAIVIDEYGGTAGLVTMEDLLEEIVGEIEDESDIAEDPIEVVNKTTILANGSVLVEDVNDHFKININANERETINIMILEHLHRFPREGETIMFPKIKVTIMAVSNNVIQRAKIQKRKVLAKSK